jgi:hypothetical protein
VLKVCDVCGDEFDTVTFKMNRADEIHPKRGLQAHTSRKRCSEECALVVRLRHQREAQRKRRARLKQSAA